MARQHRVTGSEHISQIAADNGFFDWQTIWSRNPQLAARRRNPNVLYHGDRTAAGDLLTIPDPVQRDDPSATESEHHFEVPDTTVFLRIRILKDDFTAIANAQFNLVVDGAPAPLTGATDANGQFEVEIPRTATHAVLTVRVPGSQTDTPPAAQDPSTTPARGQPATIPPSPPTPPGAVPGDAPVTWDLKIGALNPIMESAPDRSCIAGVQQRLNNLGLNTGPVDGILGPNTRAATESFQRTFGLNPDQQPGQQETQPKLEQVHDQPDSVVGPAPAPAASSSSASSSGTSSTSG